jgi:hypothetical protein
MGVFARRTLLSGGILSIGLIAATGAWAQAGVWVVTNQEAAMPPSATSKAGRAITRGPAVEFAGRGGEKINANSVQILVLRGSNVDITSRMKPYVTDKGIAIPNAMVPAGSYALQVSVKDASGRESLANVEIEAR